MAYQSLQGLCLLFVLFHDIPVSYQYLVYLKILPFKQNTYTVRNSNRIHAKKNYVTYIPINYMLFGQGGIS